jgi:hypothetical protein
MNLTRPLLISAVALAALAGSALFSDPAMAEGTATISPRTGLSQQSWQELYGAVDEASETFDGARAESSGADPRIVEDFAAGWSASGNRSVNVAVDQQRVEEIRALLPKARTCTGKNSSDYTGLQLNLYLNSCNSAKILGLVSGGAGIATIAAVVTSATGVGGVVAGTIAGTLAIMSGALTTCTANGRGMVAHNIPPTAALWCNNQ